MRNNESTFSSYRLNMNYVIGKIINLTDLDIIVECDTEDSIFSYPIESVICSCGKHGNKIYEFEEFKAVVLFDIVRLGSSFDSQFDFIRDASIRITEINEYKKLE